MARHAELAGSNVEVRASVPTMSATPDAQEPGELFDALTDPDYREGVIDLLGLLGCGEFLAFERLVSEGVLAPGLAQRLRISRIAAGELAHCEMLQARIAELGADPVAVMADFLPALEHYHAATTPADWLEGLVKAYVGDSIAKDFYREIALHLDPATAQLVTEVCAELGQTDIVLEEVRAAIAADPRLAGRLALWGRRLLGEALTQAQNIAAEREPLVRLILMDMHGAQSDLPDLAGLTGRLTSAHVARLQALGLSA